MRGAAAFCVFATLTGCDTAPEPAQDTAKPQIQTAAAPLPVKTPVAALAESDIRAGLPSSAPVEQQSLVSCSAEEQTIFFCEMPGGKRLAVCGTKGGEAQYRFGGKTPELTLAGGKWSSRPLSGGGEAQILFASGDTDYIVFSRMVRTNFAPDEPNYPAINDGVVIMRGKKFLAMRLCAGGQAEKPVNYGAAKRAFGEIEDIFTGDTMRADPPVIKR